MAKARPTEKPPKKGKARTGATTEVTLEQLERAAATAAKLSINADKLLRLLRACSPFPARGKDAPEHLKVMKFAVLAEVTLRVEATDGHLGLSVEAPLAYSTGPFFFCLHATFCGPAVKLLSRMATKERAESDATITVTKHAVTFAVQNTSVTVPRTDEQLEFPDIARVMPSEMHAGRSAVPEFGVNPDYLAKVGRAASQLAYAVRLTAPERTKTGIRIGLHENEGGFEGAFVIMPMELG